MRLRLLSSLGMSVACVAASGCYEGDEARVIGGDPSPGTPGEFRTQLLALDGTADCPEGLLQVASGVDDDGDGLLAGSEIDTHELFCITDLGGVDVHGQTVQLNDEPAGPRCVAGGQRIDIGRDDGSGGNTANDGVIEGDEIEQTQYVCNGAAGVSPFATLTKTTTESAGPACANGGQRIQLGLDNGDGGGIARDGTLQNGEVDSSKYVCNGVAGPTGPTGPTGPAGANGQNGRGMLVQSLSESPGATCAAGGLELRFGFDDGSGAGTADDNQLDDAEISHYEYVCHGETGPAGTPVVLRTSPLAPDLTCPTGGKTLAFGLDDGEGDGDASDETLHDDEVDHEFTICNGAAGHSALVDQSSAAPGDCPTGGVHVRIGKDDGEGSADPDDDVLGDDEVSIEYDLCNGATGSTGATGASGTNGINTLITSSTVGVGQDGCAAGGTRISWGLDNGDGAGNPGDNTLHADEIDDSEVVCNGATGASGSNGSDGFTMLIESFPLIVGDQDCPFGGIRLDLGLDDGLPGGTANNGQIDVLDGEIDDTIQICNGEDGSAGSSGSNGVSSLIVTSTNVGANCPGDGVRLDIGLDNGDGAGDPGDNVLHIDEYDTTHYVCDGQDGGDVGMGTVSDDNGTQLGQLISIGDLGLLIYSSTGFYYNVGWDGSFGDAQIQVDGSCATPTAYYLNAGSAGYPLYGRFLAHLDATDQFFAPDIVDRDGVLISADHIGAGFFNPTCSADTNDYGVWPVVEISRAAAGIPLTVQPPFSVQ